MKPATLKKLTVAYNNWIKNAKSINARLVVFKTPCCNKDMYTGQPPDGSVWNGLTSCPHCEGLFFKTVKGTAVQCGEPLL